MKVGTKDLGGQSLTRRTNRSYCPRDTEKVAPNIEYPLKRANFMKACDFFAPADALPVTKQKGPGLEVRKQRSDSHQSNPKGFGAPENSRTIGKFEMLITLGSCGRKSLARDH